MGVRCEGGTVPSFGYPFTAFTARATWRQVPAAGCCLEIVASKRPA